MFFFFLRKISGVSLPIADKLFHHLYFTWSNTNWDYQVWLDGEVVGRGSGLYKGGMIKHGGTLLIEQDIVNRGDSRLRDCTKPLFSPLLVLSISRRRQFPDADSLRPPARTTSKNRAVIARHFTFVMINFWRWENYIFSVKNTSNDYMFHDVCLQTTPSWNWVCTVVVTWLQ